MTSDFTSGSLTGSVTIQNNGRGQFTLTLASDGISDDNEEFNIEIYTDSSYVTKVASTFGKFAMYARDNNATYNLLASTAAVYENNQTITFTLRVKNIPPGARVPYIITGVSSSDFVGNPSLTGYFIIQKPTVDYTNFQELGSWIWHPNKQVGPDIVTGFIARGNEVSIVDELFWNTAAPSDSVTLKRISDNLKGQGYRTGLIVMPYILTHSAVNGVAIETPTVSQATLISTILASGVNFVALDPYLWQDSADVRRLNGSLYWTQSALITWTQNFKNTLISNGVAVKIVPQGFKHNSQTELEINNYNSSLLALTGVEEFIMFGFEDAGDLIAAKYAALNAGVTPPFEKINNDFVSQTYSSTVSLTTRPDGVTEGVETVTMTISGPAEYIDGTALPLNTAVGSLSVSVDIFD